MYILLVLPLLLIILLVSIALIVQKKIKYAFGVIALFAMVNWLTETIPIIPSNQSNDNEGYSVECFNINSSRNDFEKRAPLIANSILCDQPTFLYLTEYYGNSSTLLDSLLKNEYPYSACSFRKYLESERFYSKWQIDSVYNLEIDTLDTKVINRCREKPEIRSHLDRIWVYRIQINEASDTVALYCCHLDTNNFGIVRDSISDSGLGLIKHWKRFVNATSIGYAVRELETDAIVKCLTTEKYPYIVMGDMNDISGSYAIRNLQSTGLKDAWWEKGFGYGCTFHDHGMRLRLDHILYSDELKLVDVKVIDSDLSDHNPLMARFRIK